MNSKQLHHSKDLTSCVHEDTQGIQTRARTNDQWLQTISSSQVSYQLIIVETKKLILKLQAEVKVMHTYLRRR